MKKQISKDFCLKTVKSDPQKYPYKSLIAP